MQNIFYRKKITTPVTDITEPIISITLTFSLKRIIDGGIINIGTIDIMVAAIPVEVYLTDNNENETPKKGPKIEPSRINFIALLFFNAGITLFHLLRKEKTIATPTKPTSTLI